MNNEFLNKKEMPNVEQLKGIFFSEEIFNEIHERINPPDVDFVKLGIPSNIETIEGTEWMASKLEWDTPEGKIFRIDIKKVKPISGLGFFPHAISTLFPFSAEVINIDYEEVNDKEQIPFEEQLEIAIEDEDYVEASRLRDWNNTLLQLLKESKISIMEAIENEDIYALDVAMKPINEHRELL